MANGTHTSPVLDEIPGASLDANAVQAARGNTPAPEQALSSIRDQVIEYSSRDRSVHWWQFSTPTGTCITEVATPRTELGVIAETLLAQGIASRTTEALFLRKEAAILTWLAEGNRVEALGFTTVPSLALEVLGMRMRTVRDRLRLHRLFLRFPLLEEAFLEGRTSACQALAIAPILEDGGPESAIAWACRCSVRMLKKEAKSYREPKPDQELSRPRTVPEEDGEGFHISIEAPPGFRVFFDHMIESARKQLGYDAPVYKCIEAMLLETRWLGVGPPQEPLRFPRDREIDARPDDDRRGPPEAIAHARETIRQVQAYMRDVATLVESGEPKSPHDALAMLRQIQLLRAPQRVLFARLIRDLRRTNAIDMLGYRSMADLVEDRLDLSERAARDRVAESLMFESDEEIARAYATGEITILQAHLIRRMASSVRRKPFMDRAREVTWRQFQREYRMLELLRKCGLDRVARDPLPQAKVEEALIEALGGDRNAIEKDLLANGASPLPEGGSSDPAENPILMDRLETLLELLALRLWDEVPSLGTLDRQAFASSRRPVTIRFWVPLQVGNGLLHVIEKFRTRERPYIPKWAAMALFFADVWRYWRLEDPERRPAQAKILERDHYRCVIPGCTSRSQLEVSHNRPRSLGGTNAPWNLSTICHTHHHHGVHVGYVNITGRAPHALEFRMGLRPDGPPLLIYRGNKRIKRPFGPVGAACAGAGSGASAGARPGA